MRHVGQVDNLLLLFARALDIIFTMLKVDRFREAEDWRCRNAVLIIADSPGYDLYRWLEPDLKHSRIGQMWPSDKSRSCDPLTHLHPLPQGFQIAFARRFRSGGPNFVALILAKINPGTSQNLD